MWHAKIATKILLWCCEKSWFFYQRANFYVTIEGKRKNFSIPIQHGVGFGLLHYEDARIQRVFKVVIDLGYRGIFVDVGANIGQMFLNLRDATDDLPYLGFEPNIESASYLRKLIKENPGPNSDVVSVALGSEEKTSVIYTNSSIDDSATLNLNTRPAQMYAHAQRVCVSTGNSQLAFLSDNNIFLIKIDVEGYEYTVIAGMMEVLDKHNPPLYFEVLGYGHLLDRSYPRSYFGELNPDEICRLVDNRREHQVMLENLLSDRYRFYRCYDNGAINLVEKLDPGPKADSPEMNFLALPIKHMKHFPEVL